MEWSIGAAFLVQGALARVNRNTYLSRMNAPFAGSSKNKE